jgi:hypothetical protein
VIVCFVQGACYTAGPHLDLSFDFSGNFAAHHDVGHHEPAARFQHADALLHHAALVRGQVDDAIRDDYIYGVVGQRNIFDFPLEEFDILEPAWR